MPSIPSHLIPYAALASVCFFWGTTYLVIRIALESFPPMLLVCGRFLLSGSILLAVVWFRRIAIPGGSQLVVSAIHGVLILGVGSGCLTISELWIPSSLAALFVSVSPFWMVGMEALRSGGDRLRGPVVAGMLVGLAGAALLVAPGLAISGFGGNIGKGFLILQIGSVCWSLGSIRQRSLASKQDPVAAAAVQQMVVGLVYVLPALLVPQGPVQWSARGISAVLYLAVFGSVVGYTSYLYALHHLPIAVVSLYTYINPVVAALLGRLFYREPFGEREALAMGLILAGVAIVKKFSGSRDQL